MKRPWPEVSPSSQTWDHPGGQVRPLTAVEAVLQQTKQSLESSGIEDARLETELLLSHVLGVPRYQVLSYADHSITTLEIEALACLVERRLRREPLAYLLSRVEFYGLEFNVGPGVFIPRPETELLVEHALIYATKRAPNNEELVIAEPGTGSGAVSTLLAKHLPNARIFATDLSPLALTTAGLNLTTHTVSGMVTLLEGNLLEPIPERVDLIVANLPYVASSAIPGLQAEVQWEPRLALDGGSDGLDTMRSLLLQAKNWLKQDGAIILEIDPHQSRPLEELVQSLFPGATTNVEKDLAHLDRIFTMKLTSGGAG